MFRNAFSVCVGFAVLLFALNASASFVLLDDFESYNLGDSPSATAGWTGDSQLKVGQDPADAGNKTLLISSGSGKNIISL